MIACYVRVSTKRQRTDSQRAEIERWIDGNGIALSTVTWFEDTETGKHLRRPAFEKLQKAVFAGQVKTVITYKLDRLSRSLRDGVNVLADWCERGVRVVSTTQGVDLSGPVGRMVAALLLGVAEIELEYRRERQAAGIRVAKKRGAYRGRSNGTTKAKPERALELSRKGLSVPEIASAMQVSERTVFRYLAGA